MIESQVVSLTGELRTSGTSSVQEQIAPGDWRVTAQSTQQVAAATVADIGSRHGVVAETSRAEFRGTKAQAQSVLAAITGLAERPSVVMEYEGDGTTDAWVVRVISGSLYTLADVISLATTHSVTASTNRASFR